METLGKEVMETKAKLEKMETCNDKSMLYAPNAVGVDVDNCMAITVAAAEGEEEEVEEEIEIFRMGVDNLPTTRTFVSGTVSMCQTYDGNMVRFSDLNSAYKNCDGKRVYLIEGGRAKILYGKTGTQWHNWEMLQGFGNLAKKFQCPSDYSFVKCGGGVNTGDGCWFAEFTNANSGSAIHCKEK